MQPNSRERELLAADCPSASWPAVRPCSLSIAERPLAPSLRALSLALRPRACACAWVRPHNRCGETVSRATKAKYRRPNATISIHANFANHPALLLAADPLALPRNPLHAWGSDGWQLRQLLDGGWPLTLSRPFAALAGRTSLLLGRQSSSGARVGGRTSATEEAKAKTDPLSRRADFCWAPIKYRAPIGSALNRAWRRPVARPLARSLAGHQC